MQSSDSFFCYFQVTPLKLDVDKSVNTIERRCTCGSSGDWSNKMIQCCSCYRWFHEKCVHCLYYPLYLGDRLVSSYEYFAKEPELRLRSLTNFGDSARLHLRKIVELTSCGALSVGNPELRLRSLTNFGDSARLHLRACKFWG